MLYHCIPPALIFLLLLMFRGDAVFCMAAVSGDKISKAVSLNRLITEPLSVHTLTVCIYTHALCIGSSCDAT